MRWQSVGPGIMYAGAAIGVSHLVQSTRAGAGYGFALVWAVIVVHLFKYPFFEFAHRYTAAIGAAWLTLVTERNVGDSSGGPGLMLRGNGPESPSRRRRVQDWPHGAGK